MPAAGPKGTKARTAAPEAEAAGADANLFPPFEAATLEAAGPTGEAMLRLAAVHAACVALSDAAQHLRRTSMTVEAASAAALTRSLQAKAGDERWTATLEGAERTMEAAVKTFVQTSRAALDMVRDAR